MKLIDTSDKGRSYLIGESCTIKYSGQYMAMYFKDISIHTGYIRQIAREDNRLVITTENNTYILED